MTVIGIDPGKAGGIAVVGWERAVAHPMPATERDILDLIASLRELAAPDSPTAIIERVASMPKQGVVSTFTFCENYGALRMPLIAVGVPFESVSPGVWQRPFNLPTIKSAGSKVAKKNAHKARAQELFPGVKITHAVADALLLAEWGRRQKQGR